MAEDPKKNPDGGKTPDTAGAELDEALKETFPASDPVALTSPTKAGRRKPDPSPAEDVDDPQPS